MDSSMRAACGAAQAHGRRRKPLHDPFQEPLPGPVAFAAPIRGSSSIDLAGAPRAVPRGMSFLCATPVSRSDRIHQALRGVFGGEASSCSGSTARHGLHPRRRQLHRVRSGRRPDARVDPGCIVGFEETVQYDIQFVGASRTRFSAGRGGFLATTVRPGNCVLQTLPSRSWPGGSWAHAAGSGACRVGGTLRDIGNIFAGRIDERSAVQEHLEGAGVGGDRSWQSRRCSCRRDADEVSRSGLVVVPVLRFAMTHSLRMACAERQEPV